MAIISEQNEMILAMLNLKQYLSKRHLVLKCVILGGRNSLKLGICETCIVPM